MAQLFHFVNGQLSVFSTFLKALKVKHTISFSEAYYNEHPYKYSMYGLSKMLSDYHVNNQGFRLVDKKTEILEIRTPFIAHIGDSFVVVNETSIDYVSYFWNNNILKISLDEFLYIWTGNVLIANPSTTSEEPHYNENRKKEFSKIIQKTLLVLAVFLLISSLFFKYNLYFNPGLILLLIFNAIGIFICSLLVKKQLRMHSGYADRICSLFKQSDCNSILESKAAKIGGVLGWSELGLGYFIANCFSILFTPYLLQTLVLINLCALLYSFWSVWYQKHIAHQWCVLCLIIQFLFWIIACINLLFGYINVSQITIFSLLSLSAILAIPILIINICLPVFGRAAKMQYIIYELNSIKNSDEVFLSLLKKQPYHKVDRSTSSILLGNPKADNLITILTNPHCNPCAKMHERVVSLLEQSSNNLCIQYIFSSFGKELDISSKFLIATYFKNEHSDVKTIYNEGFKYGAINKEHFFTKYPLDVETELVLMEFSKQNLWKRENKINATPTIFVNGYLLPENYKIEDLRYL